MAAHIRLARWAGNHPHTGNAVLMTLGFAITGFLFLASLSDSVSWWSTLACAVPLYFRRAAPVVTAYAVGAMAVVCLLTFNVATIALCIWAVPCVIYTVAKRAPTGARRGVFAAALVGSAIFGFTSRDWFLGVLGVMSLVVEGMAVRPVVPWGSFLLILAGAVMVAVLASALPVRRATRLQPVAGLSRAH